VAAKGSTTREVFICKTAVKIAHRVLGERLRGAAVLYVGDGLGNSQVVNNWWAHDPELLAQLEELYDMCMSYGIELYCDWERRETVRVCLADTLGKDMALDSNSWELCQVVYEMVIEHFAHLTATEQHPKGRLPTVDGMADSANAKTPLFISKELSPGCAGMERFAYLEFLANGAVPDGELEHLMWLNEDFHSVTDILLAIMEYKLDTILIVPRWPLAWRHLLGRMPAYPPFPLPKREGLFTSSGQGRGWQRKTQVASATT